MQQRKRETHEMGILKVMECGNGGGCFVVSYRHDKMIQYKRYLKRLDD